MRLRRQNGSENIDEISCMVPLGISRRGRQHRQSRLSLASDDDDIIGHSLVVDCGKHFLRATRMEQLVQRSTFTQNARLP